MKASAITNKYYYEKKSEVRFKRKAVGRNTWSHRNNTRATEVYGQMIEYRWTVCVGISRPVQLAAVFGIGGGGEPAEREQRQRHINKTIVRRLLRDVRRR